MGKCVKKLWSGIDFCSPGYYLCSSEETDSTQQMERRKATTETAARNGRKIVGQQFPDCCGRVGKLSALSCKSQRARFKKSAR